MFQQTTVAFSGHNIRWFAVFAIESFLNFYPDMRGNMLYFDDDSTDGTREELEARGVKVITWSDKARADFKAMLDSGIFDDFTQTVSTRVCYIMRDIMEQVQTKYLLINDGDVVFKRGDFMEGYFDGFKEGNRIVGHREFSEFPEDHLEYMKDKKWFEYYCRFLERFDHYPGSVFAPRIHLMHTMIDLEYFKSIDMLCDRLIPEVIDLMYGGLVDTGTDFFHRVMDANIPIKWLGNEVMETLLHWGWLSSGNRDTKKMNENSKRDQVKEIETALYEHGLGEMAKKLGIHPMRLIRSFEKTLGKSIWS